VVRPVKRGRCNLKKDQIHMMSRIVLSLAAVAASVGLLLYGMGTSYSPKDKDLMSLGLIIGLVGLAVTIASIFWYRATEAAEVVQARAKYGDDGVN